jgi:predicted lipoprotein with Yx(FWY)xxD motif
MKRRSGAVTVTAVLVAVALSACGGATGRDPAASRAPGSASSTAAGAGSAGGGVPADHKTGLIMVMPSSLGEVVTDDYMFTLYRSDRDTASPSRSNCTGACAVTWPPVLTAGKVTFVDGDQASVGTVTRTDATTQLTLRGWPLYRYAGDKAEGDTKGHGVDGTWFAATPDRGTPSGAASGRP